MTQVTYKHDRDRYYFKVEGHSDGARNEHNHDLVCCACSTLGFVLVNAVNEMEYPEVLIYDGKIPQMEVKFHTSNQRLIGVVESILWTFQSLAEQYPKNIQLKMSKKGEK